MAVRFAWHGRVVSHDFAGALSVIAEGGLSDSERRDQLGELVDSLFPRTWIDEGAFPICDHIEAIYHKPNGPELLARRWSVARKALSLVNDTPHKVQLLSRLCLFAIAFDEAPRHAEKNAFNAAAAEFGDFDATGAPVRKSASTRPSMGPAILSDAKAEEAALRSELASKITVLDPTPRGRTISRFLAKGWGLIRTALLACAGALVTALGGLLIKGYSELIVRKLSTISLFHEALASTASSGSASQTAQRA
jgi:hypothetical protein